MAYIVATDVRYNFVTDDVSRFGRSDINKLKTLTRMDKCRNMSSMKNVKKRLKNVQTLEENCSSVAATQK